MVNNDMDFDKREMRRKRRLQNQIAAYVTLLVLIILFAAGSVFLIKYINSSFPQQKPADDMQETLESMIGTEEEISKPEPQETTPQQTEDEKLDEIVNAAIEVMPLEDKVAGLFIVAPESITGVGTAVQAGEGTKEALGKYAVGGFVYFKKNITSAEQIKEMIGNTVSYSRYPLFIGVDEEGGSVSRVAESGIASNVGTAAQIGATADPSKALEAGRSVAGYLTPLGFNLDFAPVGDISAVEGSVIGDRAYGSDSTVVASMASSMIQGLQENGVSACLKHFPGIGSSIQDTHKGLASTSRTAEEFRANEFSVFQTGIDAGVDFVMISHMSAPSLAGDNTPCTFSKVVVTDILRSELNFNGVIVTDALNMTAVTEYYGADEAAIMALKAGCDMLLMPENFELAYTGVLDAVKNGTISEERVNDSLRRIYRIKYADKLAQ